MTVAPVDEDLVTLRALMTAYAAQAPVRTIAVVGNAPLEPSGERAQGIDSADLVFRCNSFVMDRPGEPRCQGRRVDVVVWNRITRATEFVYADYRNRLYVMVEPMRMHGNPEMWPTSWPEDLGFVVAPNRSVALPINRELGVDWERERLAPTTGLTSAWLAVNAFPEAEVRLAGFSFLDDSTQTSWSHQWGDSCPVGPEHRIAAEAALMQSWLDSGRARFLR